ncbi:glycogen debranching protein GlgX [Rhizorhabdus dicambivorans]|uniref:Glycogen debranching enzyme GlgX n=1 Tax=Rhizorhabdus dicambivorans TaxID=1850238 RepID=A0A2A4G2V6_9SPHN|nr:glycogen debranching protein GlgX [Rhizorhabdus dicambivorans]ATE65093.1 glycogen debranching enzyme GlgX [Rhizorhabdus dicambivorans]PCE44366.1 glycogen debranching enzyme GlgX [Rhizorhabdus dicambivorans]
MASPPPRYGATIVPEGVHFAIWSETADAAWVCIFDEDDRETRVPLERGPADVFQATVPGLTEGARYGFRADGPYDPAIGNWFDPAKLLADPYAVAIDRPYAYDPRLAARREEGIDTAPLMPKAVVTALPAPLAPEPPRFAPGGLIYEVNVRGFTRLHPAVPEGERGTIAALGRPEIIDHLGKIGVGAVELMPITAWIDERHLGPLGLSNSWGYNPVGFMALDPRLAPGGLDELRRTVAALHDAGIAVLLDVVFNHSGESDALGPTLSLRGIDNHAYFKTIRDEPGTLANDSGCGNTLDCDHPATRRLILDAMRHFVTLAGIDGFRFDLAPILGRGRDGFEPNATLLREMRNDPILSDRILIAEPWDIGPGGYQLGNFGEPFLEWNDRYRDDVRRFWRGDPHSIGDLATRLAGSSDIFGNHGRTHSRSVNFIASHDGFTLADLTAYATKHNEANGEANRDGHNDNYSWNNGAEGPTEDPGILAARRRDIKALLATLFASRGTIMLTAGDEFGRSQRGNNNAYAQDNAVSWIDWQARDSELEQYVAGLAAARGACPVLSDPVLLGGADVDWLTFDGREFDAQDWHDPRTAALVMLLHLPEQPCRIAIAFNREDAPLTLALSPRPGHQWRRIDIDGATFTIDPRSVGYLIEEEGP